VLGLNSFSVMTNEQGLVNANHWFYVAGGLEAGEKSGVLIYRLISIMLLRQLLITLLVCGGFY